MPRTPPLHYDYLRRKVPTGWQLYDLVRQGHVQMSNEDLLEGSVMEFLNELDETTRHMTYAMLMYERLGQNTYVVGPRVRELFRRTELARVTEDLLEAPVEAFYVALPDCPWTIWGGARTRQHEVRGVYVTFSKSVTAPGRTDAAPRIHLMVWGSPNQRSLGPGDDALLWFSIDLGRCFSSGEDFESFFRRTSVMTTEPGSAEEAEWGGGDPFDALGAPLLPEEREVLLEQRETLIKLLRVVLNVCLYVSSEEPDLEVTDNEEVVRDLRRQAARKKSPGRRRKLERRIANLPRVRIVYVGPLFEELGKSGNGGGARGTHASPVEHEVPPHYQHYWVGSGDDRRRVLRYKGMYVRGAGRPDRTVVKFRE